MSQYSHEATEKIRQPAEAGLLPFAVYAIYNENAQKIYIGQTKDLSARIEMHNRHTLGGYTSRFSGDWRLIYAEWHSTRKDALQREHQLKSFRGREFIKNKIQ